MASGFYTKGGKHRPISGTTLFRPTKNQEAAEHVKLDTKANAETSVAWLDGQWREARTRDHRVHLVEYANEAANRAGVISRNKRNSESQRREAASVHQVYRSWVVEHEGKE